MLLAIPALFRQNDHASMRALVQKPAQQVEVKPPVASRNRALQEERGTKRQIAAPTADSGRLAGWQISSHHDFDFSRIPLYPDRLQNPVRTQATRTSSPFLQGKPCSCGGTCSKCRHHREEQADSTRTLPPSVQSVVGRGGGRPLDDGTRTSMGGLLAHDLGHVRLHTGSGAEKSADSVNALAYTVGHEIVFGREQFAPETSAGRRLLAHELTHVVQQSRGLGNPSVGAESEAESAGRQVAAGRSVQVQSAAPVSIQRQQKSVFGQSLDADKGYEIAGSIAKGGTPLKKSVDSSHWNSDAERQAFIRNYINYARDHNLSPQYQDAIAAYPDFNTDKPVNTGIPWVSTPPAAPPTKVDPTKTSPAIAKLPYRTRPIPTVQFMRLGFLGMGGLITVTPAAPSIQMGPDPTAGYNFDTYLVNMEAGAPIPAQWLGGTRYRVLMGTPECPGCHFGRGLEVDLMGEHPLFIAGTMALQAAPILVDMAAARTVMAEEEALAMQGKGAGANPGKPVPTQDGSGTATLQTGGKPPVSPPVEGNPPGGGGGTPAKQPAALKASGKVDPGTAGNRAGSAQALADREAAARPSGPLPAGQQQMADSLINEHPGLNSEVAKDSVKGGASAAGKGGKGADIPLLNGGGREVSVHTGAFTGNSVGSHLLEEAAQQGTTEIYLQVNTQGATREGLLKMMPELRSGYVDLRGIFVKFFGPDGSVWWSGTFGGPS